MVRKHASNQDGKTGGHKTLPPEIRGTGMPIRFRMTQLEPGPVLLRALFGVVEFALAIDILIDEGVRH